MDCQILRTGLGTLRRWGSLGVWGWGWGWLSSLYSRYAYVQQVCLCTARYFTAVPDKLAIEMIHCSLGR